MVTRPLFFLMAAFTIRKDKHTFSMEDQPDATIIERQGGIIVVKVPWHKERHGRGISTPRPAEYQVWQITEIKDLGEILQGNAEWLIDFPVNAKNQCKSFEHHTSTA